MQSRVSDYLGKSTRRWQKRLIADVIDANGAGYPPSPATLADRLLHSSYFDRAVAVVLRRDTPPALVLDPPAFAPAPAFASMHPPRIETVGDLAAWLDVPIARLDWLADEKRQHGRTSIPILLHYHYRFIAKRRGGPPRLVEAPKPHLKALQRRILREILDLAPLHPQAHGFVRGRSCLTGAQAHAGEHVVVCADLRDFFPSIRASRIHGLFRSFGYPWAIARALTGLCTTSTPRSVFTRIDGGQQCDWRTRKMFGAPHLPQGAPTSPVLANLCTWRFDQRCTGLARALGGRYTRYADDLAFSGDAAFAARVAALIEAVSQIAKEEGFAINPAKTRVMRRSRPQRVTGVIVNEHINFKRSAYNSLKAVLHNCRKHGPDSQNREGHRHFRAHLDGRVGWVEQVNPARGAKLRAEFDAISWP
ncbi:MAG: reverse transcriptase family protein [Hyphomonadaceae bacterium]